MKSRSKVRVPGVDLAEDDMWQVVETELMMREDYDRLLHMGWPEYSAQCQARKCQSHGRRCFGQLSANHALIP